MKGSFKLRDLQENAKQNEPWIIQPVCLVCGKNCEGYYARFGERGTCSKACMVTYEKGVSHVHIERTERKEIRLGVASVPIVFPPT